MTRFPLIFLLVFQLGFVSASHAQFGLFKKKKKEEKTESPEKYTEGTKKQRIQFAFGEAQRYKLIDQLDKALAYFLECIKMDPDMAAAYYEVSNIYHQYNELQLALKYSEKAAELDKDNYWYQVLRIETLEKLKRNDEALKYAVELLEKNPKDQQLTMKVVYLHFVNAEYKKGISILEDYEKKFGLTPELLNAKKSAYLQIGENEKAIEELKKIIEMDPGDIRNYFELSDLLRSMGKKDEAKDVFEELKRTYPNESKINLALAKYYNDERENAAAFKELVPVFADSTVNIDLKIEILLSYLQVVSSYPEFKDEADELNQILIKAHPKNAKSHTIYGDFLYNDGKLDRAKYHFNEAVKLDSSRFAIWNQLIVIEAEQEHYDSVIVIADRVKELFPNQASLYYYSGIAHTQLDNLEDAVEDYERGRMLVIDNPLLELQFFLGLGDAYNELQKFDKSDEAFARALRIDPDNAIALNNYAYYLSLRNERLERALEMSAKSNKLSPNQSSYLDTYSWILYKLERYEEAAEWIEKAMVAGGMASGEVLEHAGDIYFKLGDKSKAINLWKRAKPMGGGSELLNKKIEDQELYE